MNKLVSDDILSNEMYKFLSLVLEGKCNCVFTGDECVNIKIIQEFNETIKKNCNVLTFDDERMKEYLTESLAGHPTILSLKGDFLMTERMILNYAISNSTQSTDIDIPLAERIIANIIDYVFVTAGGRLLSVVEVSYDYELKKIIKKAIYRYNFELKDYVFENEISEEKVEKMLRSGVSILEMKPCKSKLFT